MADGDAETSVTVCGVWACVNCHPPGAAGARPPACGVGLSHVRSRVCVRLDDHVVRKNLSPGPG
eukprot:2752619-Prymnesium_polylepis.3